MSELKMSDFKAVIDTREQRPLTLDMPCEVGTLDTGDYSILGLTDLIAVERKSLEDLIACMTSGRDRFERELRRLKAYPVRCVVVEANWYDLEQGNYRSKLNALAATHTVASWTARFCVPFQFVGTHDAAGRFVSYFLFTSAKRVVSRALDALPHLNTQPHSDYQ